MKALGLGLALILLGACPAKAAPLLAVPWTGEEISDFDAWQAEDRALRERLLQAFEAKRRGDREAALRILAEGNPVSETEQEIFRTLGWNDCRYGQCVAYGRWSDVVQTPSTLATPNEVLYEAAGCTGTPGYTFDYIPISEPSHFEYVTRLEQTIEADGIWDCSELRCITVHRPAGEPAPGRSWAEFLLCETVRIEETYGAPAKCVAAVKIVRGERLVPVISGRTFVGCYAPGPKPITELDVPRAVTPALMQAIATRLSGSPGQYRVGPLGTDGLLAVVGHRRSPIIRNRFETATVSIHLVRRNQGGGNYALVAHITLYLNPQNTERSSDYRKPSPSEEARYERFIADEVMIALRPLCPETAGVGRVRCGSRR